MGSASLIFSSKAVYGISNFNELNNKHQLGRKFQTLVAQWGATAL